MGKIPKKSSRKKSKRLPPSLTQLHRSHKDDVKVSSRADEPTARQAAFSKLLVGTAEQRPKNTSRKRSSKLLELPDVARFAYESEEAYVRRAARVTMHGVQQEMSRIREETNAEAADIRDAANKAKGIKRLRRQALKKVEAAKKRRLAKEADVDDDDDGGQLAARSVRDRSSRKPVIDTHGSERKSRLEFSQQTERVSFGETVSAPPTFTDDVRRALGIDASKKAGSRCTAILDMVKAAPSTRQGVMHVQKTTVNETTRNEAIAAYRAIKKARHAQL